MRAVLWTAVLWSICVAGAAVAEEKAEPARAAEEQVAPQAASPATEASAATADEATPAEPSAAQTVQVLLALRGNQGGNRLERIVAQGEIEIQQPGRTATGNQAVYTAQDEKFVLTASNGARPTIFDAQRGQISGDSLTFYTHDDRVLVDSKESSKTLIQTRIRDASKK